MNTTTPTAAAEPDLDCPELNGVNISDAILPCLKPPAGRPRAADKEARLLALLETAGRLFLEKGYSKVSLEMIAREAHVAVRTIYVKFGGKAGLLQAVIAAGRARFFAGMDSMETDSRPLEAILDGFALRFLDLVSAPSFLSLHRMVVAEAIAIPELAESFFEAGPKRTRDELTKLFSRPDIRARLRPELGTEVLCVHLLNCIMGDSMMRMLFPRAQDPDEASLQAQARLGVDLFLRSVLR
ncbi:TetR/AcrR family transcriptional regulator [Oxalobacteraceae bacterium A2-2]